MRFFVSHIMVDFLKNFVPDEILAFYRGCVYSRAIQESEQKKNCLVLFYKIFSRHKKVASSLHIAQFEKIRNADQ